MTSELRPPSELHQPSPQTTTLYLPTYLPTYLPIYLPTYLSTHLPTYLPIYLPIYLSTYLPTYLHPRRRRHAYRMATPPQSGP